MIWSDPKNIMLSGKYKKQNRSIAQLKRYNLYLLYQFRKKMEICKATLSGVRVFTATQGYMNVKCVGFVHGVLGREQGGQEN